MNQSMSDSKILLLIDNSFQLIFRVGMYLGYVKRKVTLEDMNWEMSFSALICLNVSHDYPQPHLIKAMILGLWIRLAMAGGKRRLCYFSARVDYIAKINPHRYLLPCILHSGRQ